MRTKMIRTFLIAALLALAGVVPALGQTSLTTTTLSAAVNASSNQVTIASATGVSAGSILFMDREAMRVTSITGTVANVSRGYSGTMARAHAASTIVYAGAPVRFYADEVVPGSVCTAASELYLPHIVLPSGNVYQCTNSVWYSIGSTVGSIQASFVQGGTAADAIDTVFFLADRDYVVTAISAVWSTAETTGSMDIQVEKLTGTTACASGTDQLSAVIAATGTANTVNNGALTTTAADHLLAAGNRLCVDLTATPNEVVNMVVTATLVPR
jgi:hypothetical protein